MNIDWQGAGDVQSIFGSLIEDELNAHVKERDQNSIVIPNEVIEKFARLGLYKYNLPGRFGGRDAGYYQWGKVLEELGYLSQDTSFPFLISVRMSVITFLIAVDRQGIVDQFVDPLVQGALGGAFAYTENADAFSFKSNARPEQGGESYILNGVKHLVTGGETADLFIVFVRSETSDMQVFLVKSDDPGVEVAPRIMHGVRSFGMATLSMSDVVLGKERLLVATDGLSFAQRYFLNCRRSLQTTLFLGRARAVIEETIGYLKKTVRYGVPLVDMQHVQANIGEMYIALETARTVVFHSLERQARGESDPYWDVISSTAKYHAVEEINFIATMSLKLTGGWGYTESIGIGRAHRDFTALIAGADPQEKLKVDLGLRMVHELDMIQQRDQYKEV
ncbi:acyl-CoA dehydrogenase family protein [Pseudomonas versuta]|uniref:acyl-CoA dehydrogenase family protein n=1 Tax=Pseudomonas TaxID=286 RepID=UPI0037C93935